MEIWIVNLFDEFPSKGGYECRIFGLIRELESRGNNVTLWTSNWSHANKVRRKFPNEEEIRAKVILIESMAYTSNIGLRRFFSHIFSAKRFIKMGLNAVSEGRTKPHLIMVSTPPPSMLKAAAKLKQCFGCSLLIDIQDAWPENFIQIVPAKFPFRQWICRVISAAARSSTANAYQLAIMATAVSQDYIDLAKSYGLTRGKVFYIGAPAERFKEALPMEAKVNYKTLCLAYVGSFSTSYDLETIFKAVAFAKRQGIDVRIYFAGKGPLEKSFKRWAKNLSIQDNVVLMGMLNQEELRAMLEQVHLGLVGVKNDSWIAMPNKITDYLTAGLPILHSRKTGELARLVSARRIGSVYESGDAVELLELIKFYNTANGKLQLKTQSRNARRIAKQSFDRRKIYREFVDEIEILIGRT